MTGLIVFHAIMLSLLALAVLMDEVMLAMIPLGLLFLFWGFLMIEYPIVPAAIFVSFVLIALGYIAYQHVTPGTLKVIGGAVGLVAGVFSLSTWLTRRRRLIASKIRIAKRHLQIGWKDSALRVIDEGLQLDKQNRKLLKLKEKCLK